jgi:hypothetical protein
MTEVASVAARRSDREIARTARGFVDALPDRALVAAVGILLFALAAWPLLLVEVPPFQDLPNHLASAHIAEHLDLYPDLAFNGLAKSNSMLELFLHLAGDDHLLLAGKLFTAIVLALTAFALPYFALHFIGRRRMLVSALFTWPLVHSFFLSMGMMNFTFAVPLSLILIVQLDRQRKAPSWPRGLAIALLAGVLWYAHPFPLLVAGALTLLEVLRRPTWLARWKAGLVLLAPLVPVGLLVVGTALQHVMKAEGAPVAASSGFAFLTIWELPAHFWLDCSGAFTRWGSTTIVPAVLLLYVAFRNRRVIRPFFSKPATLGLIVLYLGLPLMLSNWWYLNTRLVPFLWAAFALRVPPRLPRAVVGVLVGSALAFSVATGVDYVRLDRDRAELTAGIAAVPERATLLPLLFQHRRTSEFVATLTHDWGYYVMAKNTSAPLAFAVERSYALTYKNFPPPSLIPPALDRFAELHGTPAQVCAADPSGDLGRDANDCVEAWRTLWGSFWHKAEPRFTHILTWAMPPEARGVIPPSYHRIFVEGDLEIYARP